MFPCGQAHLRRRAEEGGKRPISPHAGRYIFLRQLEKSEHLVGKRLRDLRFSGPDRRAGVGGSGLTKLDVDFSGCTEGRHAERQRESGAVKNAGKTTGRHKQG